MSNAKYFDDNRRYVIVVNRSGILSPIRHIVGLQEGVPYFTDEFQPWYYDQYRKLEGDEFIYCLSTKEMQEKKTQIEKEWEETMTVEDKKEAWEKFKASQSQEGK